MYLISYKWNAPKSTEYKIAEQSSPNGVTWQMKEVNRTRPSGPQLALSFVLEDHRLKLPIQSSRRPQRYPNVPLSPTRDPGPADKQKDFDATFPTGRGICFQKTQLVRRVENKLLAVDLAPSIKTSESQNFASMVLRNQNEILKQKKLLTSASDLVTFAASASLLTDTGWEDAGALSSETCGNGKGHRSKHLL